MCSNRFIFMKNKHTLFTNLRNLIFIVAAISLMSGCAKYAKEYGEAAQSAQSAYDIATSAMNSNKGSTQQSQKSNSPSPTSPSKNSAGLTPDQEMGRILMAHERYYEREQYFKEIDLETYGINAVSSPDKNDFINLYIPMHKGLPRVGISPSLGESGQLYSNNYNPSDPREFNIKKALADRMTQDIVTYVQLASLYSKKKLITPARLKVDESGLPDNKKKPKRYLFSYKGFVPRHQVEFSANRTFSPAVYEYYQCVKSGNCLKGYKLRGGRQAMGYWGGRKASEFESRKKYHEFVDKMVPKILRWGSTLSRNIYIVNSAIVVKYDFDKRGVIIHLSPPLSISRSASSNSNKMKQNLMYYKPKNKNTDVFKGYPTKQFSAFIPMNETKGENFMKRANKNRNQIFFAFKAHFYDYAANKYGNLYEPLEKKLTFYWDNDLKDPLHTTSKLETLN